MMHFDFLLEAFLFALFPVAFRTCIFGEFHAFASFSASKPHLTQGVDYL
jgi:hypothetical protein